MKVPKKGQKHKKMAFPAFFLAEGKGEEIRAILRRQESPLNHFVSADKAQNRASRAEAKEKEISAK